MALEITKEETPRPEDVKRVENIINEFNAQQIQGDIRPFNLFLKDEQERIVGGLLAHNIWGWMFVAILAIEEPYRGQGYGTKLLQMAEEAAVEHDCHGIYLDTFSFQALPFYENLGYEVFGELDGFNGGHSRYYLKKYLKPVAAEGSGGSDSVVE